MALYYTANGRAGCIHIGTIIRCEHIPHITQIQADGDELGCIARNCTSIPWPSDTSQVRVVSWYGDHAKFIMSVWNSVNRNSR